ncbi:MAG: hypothetical protein ABW032_03805, partial [Burkholderiaceae bacterium]
DYMRENKIEAVAPALGPDGKAKTADAGDSGAAAPPSAPKAKDKAGDRADKTAAAEADKATAPR